MSPLVLILGVTIVGAAAWNLFRGGFRGALHPARIYAVLFIIHVGVPAILVGLDEAPPFSNASNSHYLVPALVFSLVSLIFTVAGAKFGTRLRAGSAQTVGDVHWKLSRVLFVVALLVASSWAAKILVINSDAYFQMKRAVQGDLQGPYYALIRMMEQFSLFAIILLNVYRWRVDKSQRRWIGHLANVLTILEFFYWLPSGRKEETILTLLLPMATKHLLTGYLPSRRTIIALVTFVAVLFPLSHYYRLQLEVNLGEVKVTDARALADLVSRSASTAEAVGKPGEVAFNRVSLLEPIAACIRLITTSSWDLFWGRSYAEVLLGLVPRAMWADKPNLHYGNEFGHAAGYLSSGDDVTSISVTYVGESFLNFSWIGFLAMFCMAAGFGVLYRLATNSPNRAMYAVLYLIAFPSLLYFGGTFALHFGGLIKLLPFFAFICWCLRTQRR